MEVTLLMNPELLINNIEILLWKRQTGTEVTLLMNPELWLIILYAWSPFKCTKYRLNALISIITNNYHEQLSRIFENVHILSVRMCEQNPNRKWLKFYGGESDEHFEYKPKLRYILCVRERTFSPSIFVVNLHCDQMFSDMLIPETHGNVYWLDGCTSVSRSLVAKAGKVHWDP